MKLYEKKYKPKGKDKCDIEIAAERWAQILVSQIGFNKNKDKNSYEKRR